MADPIVTVFFTGIVYLAGRQNAIEVIVPRFQDEIVARHVAVPEHVPFLKVAMEDIPNFASETANRPPDFVLKARGDDIAYAYFVLRNETLKLNGIDANKNPLKVVQQTMPDCCGGQDTDASRRVRQPFGLVAARQKVCSTCGPLRVDYTVDGPHVAARMSFAVGRFAAAFLPDDVWTFKAMRMEFQGDSQFNSKIAEAVAADFVIPGNVLVITLSGSQSQQVKPLKLTFGNNRKVNVWIGNMPATDILVTSPEREDETEDHHFLLYYTMLQPPIPDDPPIPHRAPHPRRSGAIVGSNCPPFADAIQ